MKACACEKNTVSEFWLNELLQANYTINSDWMNFYKPITRLSINILHKKIIYSYCSFINPQKGRSPYSNGQGHNKWTCTFSFNKDNICWIWKFFFFLLVLPKDSSPQVWCLLLDKESWKHALTANRWVNNLLLSCIVKWSMWSYKFGALHRTLQKKFLIVSQNHAQWRGRLERLHYNNADFMRITLVHNAFLFARDNLQSSILAHHQHCKNSQVINPNLKCLSVCISETVGIFHDELSR